jgi:phage terminase small subunit
MPNNVRELRGNPGKRKSPIPIVGSPGLPRPPAWIRGEALKEWNRIVPELDRMGLISHVDGARLGGLLRPVADLL